MFVVSYIKKKTSNKHPGIKAAVRLLMHDLSRL